MNDDDDNHIYDVTATFDEMRDVSGSISSGIASVINEESIVTYFGPDCDDCRNSQPHGVDACYNDACDADVCDAEPCDAYSCVKGAHLSKSSSKFYGFEKHVPSALVCACNRSPNFKIYLRVKSIVSIKIFCGGNIDYQ